MELEYSPNHRNPKNTAQLCRLICQHHGELIWVRELLSGLATLAGKWFEVSGLRSPRNMRSWATVHGPEYETYLWSCNVGPPSDVNVGLDSPHEYYSPDAPWCWNINLHNWAVFLVFLCRLTFHTWSIWVGIRIAKHSYSSNVHQLSYLGVAILYTTCTRNAVS